MEDLWKRARVFAEEAAKKSQTLTPTPNQLADLFSETAKKSKELALEATRKAEQLKIVALKQADQIQQIKSISDIIPPKLSALSLVPDVSSSSSSSPAFSDTELAKFGVTEDLRDFVKGLTSDTFKNFDVQYEKEDETDVPRSNVRKDLTEWQERHANLVLATVKPISKLRYDLCPRVMKEKIFWRIYFTLVSTHVAPFEKQYMEELVRKSEEQKTVDDGKHPTVSKSSYSDTADKAKDLESKTSNASAVEDLDTFLLGDLEDSDGGGPDDADQSFEDDDFDKIGNSDMEDDKHSKKSSSEE